MKWEGIAFPQCWVTWLRTFTIEIVIDLDGIVILHGGWGIVQHRQQILLHVPYLRGVFFEAVEHEADVFAIQFQQPGLHHRLGEVIPRHPDRFLPGADSLHHQLHHLVQLIFVPGALLDKLVIADVLPDHLPIGVHLPFAHTTASVSLPSLRFRLLCHGRYGDYGKG